jgi:hypothetical protein
MIGGGAADARERLCRLSVQGTKSRDHALNITYVTFQREGLLAQSLIPRLVSTACRNLSKCRQRAGNPKGMPTLTKAAQARFGQRLRPLGLSALKKDVRQIELSSGFSLSISVSSLDV